VSIFSFFRSKSPDEIFQEAQALQHRGNYIDAKKLYLSIIQKNTGHHQSCNALAWVLAITNSDLNIARELAEHAIKTAGDRDLLANYHDTLAEVYLRQGAYDEAIASFRTAISMSSGVVNENQIDYSASYRLAICHLSKNHITEAFDNANVALSFKPKNPHIYSLMGDICLSMGRHASAIDYYQEGAGLASSWNFNLPVRAESSSDEKRNHFVSVCWCQIGACYYHLGDYDNCKFFYEKSYQTYRLPISAINLAALAARKSDNINMQKYLEQGIPFLDPAVNSDTISFMLSDVNFEEYRDIVLDLLKSHGKISHATYLQNMNSWYESRKLRGKKMKIDLSGSEGSVLAFRPNTNVSTNVSGPNTNVSTNVSQNLSVGEQTVGDTFHVEGDVTGSALGREARAKVRDITVYKQAVDQSPSLDKDMKRALKEAREALETTPLSERL
jgi:tetratricopeptide (TPR) repeat protein